MTKVVTAPQASRQAIVYEYGVRLDNECVDEAFEQIQQARRLYNRLVESIRTIVEDLRQFILERAGNQAQELDGKIASLGESFSEAKARNDEAMMRQIAQERRAAWGELTVLLKATRAQYKAEVQARYLGRIGRNAQCDTYRIRTLAVHEGLGWATANAVLDAALLAFKKSFARGKAPRFASAAERTQDSLTLQFTAAGGVSSEDLLAGRNAELSILPTQGCGRRSYGEFKFRLGAAERKAFATGTWQYHRPLPNGSRVALARLVRRRVGKDDKWVIQLVVKSDDPVHVERIERHPLVAVHFGWAADIEGRRIGAVADSADPGCARLLRLPPCVEEGLKRAASIQSSRDIARDEIVPRLKAIDPETLPPSCIEEFTALRRLPVPHIAVSRLHRFHRLLRESGVQFEWFDEWRKTDRLAWQASSHIARRARMARRDFYRKFAIDLARRYEAIAIEPLDLAEAATKIDEITGERTQLARKARSGRVVAALYELESALKWAACKTGSAVLEISGATVAVCAHCRERTVGLQDDHSMVECKQCGALTDRKLNGAAVAWQSTWPVRDELVLQYHSEVAEEAAIRLAKTAKQKAKMAAGRWSARTSSTGITEGSR